MGVNPHLARAAQPYEVHSRAGQGDTTDFARRVSALEDHSAAAEWPERPYAMLFAWRSSGDGNRQDAYGRGWYPGWKLAIGCCRIVRSLRRQLVSGARALDFRNRADARSRELSTRSASTNARQAGNRPAVPPDYYGSPGASILGRGEPEQEPLRFPPTALPGGHRRQGA